MPTFSVLLATDGSRAALAAAAWLDRWMASDDLAVTLLTVIMPPSPGWIGAGGSVVDPSLYEKTYEQLVAEATREAHAVLATTEQTLRHVRVVGHEVIVGMPARAIVEYTKSHPTDLIVMGRRGHSAIGNLLGSVSYGVLHRSIIPVTVVNG